MPMTLMRIRQVVPCATDNRVVIVLEDAPGRRVLTFYADPEEARRLARELARGRRVCHPIYDFVHGLLNALQVAATHVVLEDVNGRGIGSLVCLRHAESEIRVRCYPPDALAFALRSGVPIYATGAALAHAEPLPSNADTEHRRGEVEQWLEGLKPGDFSSHVEDKDT
jgi:bifunctional DNase/RNase